MSKIIVPIKQFNSDYTALKNIIFFEIEENDLEYFESCLNHNKNVCDILDELIEYLEKDGFKKLESYNIGYNF